MDDTQSGTILEIANEIETKRIASIDSWLKRILSIMGIDISKFNFAGDIPFNIWMIMHGMGDVLLYTKRSNVCTQSYAIMQNKKVFGCVLDIVIKCEENAVTITSSEREPFNGEIFWDIIPG